MAQTRAGKVLDEAYHVSKVYQHEEGDLFAAAILAQQALELARFDGNPRLESWSEIAIETFVSRWAEQAADALALL